MLAGQYIKGKEFPNREMAVKCSECLAETGQFKAANDAIMVLHITRYRIPLCEAHLASLGKIVRDIQGA